MVFLRSASTKSDLRRARWQFRKIFFSKLNIPLDKKWKPSTIGAQSGKKWLLVAI
jgi:hypothetical protein